MRIIGLTVGRNEQHRYLEPMLEHMSGLLDHHFFYDDASTDDTFDIARKYCSTWIRQPDVPSFVESEGAFRADAWRCMETYMGPQLGDWIIVIDCDEVLVCTLPYEWRSCLHLLCESAPSNVVAIDLAIPEVFGIDIDGCPLIREDRLWGTIHAPRLCRYFPGAQYYGGPGFGVPAVPSYVMGGPWESTDQIQLMHYGYARREDQSLKYERYSSDNGHSNAHVQSIIAEDRSLVRWKTGYVKSMSEWSSPLTAKSRDGLLSPDEPSSPLPSSQ